MPKTENLLVESQSIFFNLLAHKAKERLVLHHLLCYLFPILNQKGESGFKTRYQEGIDA